MGRVNKPIDRMKPGQHRRLTDGECALGRDVFGEEIDWRSVRIVQAPSLGFGAMVPLGRTIIFSRWRAARDFVQAPLDEQGWLVHELMHVWQAKHGVFLAGAKLSAIGSMAYTYKPEPHAKLKHYNIERQAEIARHLFLARSGSQAAIPPQDWLEEVWASRFA